jgi:hypothetical protein
MPASRQEAYVSVMSGLGIAQASTAICNSELRFRAAVGRVAGAADRLCAGAGGGACRPSRWAARICKGAGFHRLRCGVQSGSACERAKTAGHDASIGSPWILCERVRTTTGPKVETLGNRNTAGRPLNPRARARPPPQQFTIDNRCYQ